MKKFVNHVDDVLTEALSGFGAAHGDLVRVHYEPDLRHPRASRPGPARWR